MSEIVISKSKKKKKKALFFFSKTRIFLRKKEKRAARFDSNEHENHEFPDIFSNLFRRKIKIIHGFENEARIVRDEKNHEMHGPSSDNSSVRLKNR